MKLLTHAIMPIFAVAFGLLLVSEAFSQVPGQTQAPITGPRATVQKGGGTPLPNTSHSVRRTLHSRYYRR